MLVYILLLLSIVSLQSLRTQIQMVHFGQKSQMAHCKSALNPPVNFRHQLITQGMILSNKKRQYLVQPLKSTHVSFLIKINVSGFQYKLNVDTGSSDFWVKGEKTNGRPELKYSCHCDYLNQRSQKYKLGYLDGHIHAYAEKVNVEFGGHKIAAEALIAYQADVQFKDVEGILGLSYPFRASHRPTLMESLIKNGIINSYAYGFNLNLIEKSRSFISFGDPDPQLYQGNLSKHKLTSQQHLKIDFKSVSIGQNSKNLTITTAILDTGNTAISIPKRYGKDIENSFTTASNKCLFFAEQGIKTFQLMKCKVGKFEQLPTIYMLIGEHRFSIEKQYYLQNCIPVDNAYYCLTYLETVNIWWESDTIFLGDGFFNRFYTHFDLDKGDVGIAKNKENITLDKILKIDGGLFSSDDWIGL